MLHDLCTSISDKDLQILLSQKNIASSLLDDLLVQCSNNEPLLKKKRVEANAQKASESDSKNSPALDRVDALKKSITLPPALNSSNTHLAKESEDKKVDKEPPKIKREPYPSEVSFKTLYPPSLSINMSSSQLLAACKGLGSNGVPNYSVYAELCPPPTPPDAPYPPATNLLPPTPSVMIDNKKDAFSPQLQEFCLANPIAVIRGLTNVLKLGKFFNA